jgi:thymidylate synthase, flavin-dependent
MEVNLISVTEHITAGPKLTAEELIVYIARVSNPSNQNNHATADKLIGYLIKNKHWSPFEMVDLTVEIVTSRAIAQQILRHRSFSFQEFSQRYAEATEMEPIQLRRQADKNRQSSAEPIDTDAEIEVEVGCGVEASIETFIQQHLEFGEELYKALLKHGVAKECARMVLPLTTQTRIYMKGSIRSWIHYLQQRTSEHTQLEHRQVAVEIAAIFENLFPNVAKALANE